MRVGVSERHLAQDVALGKDASDPEFGIDHSDGSYMVVEHFIDSVGHAGIERHRRDFPVTKFQHAHKHPPPAFVALP